MEESSHGRNWKTTTSKESRGASKSADFRAAYAACLTNTDSGSVGDSTKMNSDDLMKTMLIKTAEAELLVSWKQVVERLPTNLRLLQPEVLLDKMQKDKSVFRDV